MKNTLQKSFIVSAVLILAGCGSQQIDVHDANRETKAYETVDLAALDKEQIIQHLNTLVLEMEKATSEKLFGEMHHLEIALTAALERLSNLLSDSEQAAVAPIIENLKTIAMKIHTAGHDQNEVMAGKLNVQLKASVEKLINGLEL